MDKAQAYSANSRSAVIPVHTIGRLSTTCQPCQTSMIEGETAGVWIHIRAQTQVQQRMCRQAYYRDMKETPTRTQNNVNLSLNGQDDDMATLAGKEALLPWLDGCAVQQKLHILMDDGK